MLLLLLMFSMKKSCVAFTWMVTGSCLMFSVQSKQYRGHKRRPKDGPSARLNRTVTLSLPAYFCIPPKGVSTLSRWWGLCHSVTRGAMPAIV
jgi:hypothetical protein